MRFKAIIIRSILVAALGNPLTAAAQSVSSSEDTHVSSNVIERIETASGGNVEIEIPSDILHLLVSPPTAPKKNVEVKRQPNLKPGINKIRGFRVQVFADGRNQNTLESRVKMRANAISARFPKYRGQVYTFSHSPNWYCRVGNFQTQKEAAAALVELKRAFPAFAGEMRVVNSEIVVIK
ncbi:MAG: SPOR domain-containing protein [Bacteroides sp.]|nr:SPOR domain-containing protein [Bacteroides sp.]